MVHTFQIHSGFRCEFEGLGKIWMYVTSIMFDVDFVLHANWIIFFPWCVFHFQPSIFGTIAKDKPNKDDSKRVSTHMKKNCGFEYVGNVNNDYISNLPFNLNDSHWTIPLTIQDFGPKTFSFLFCFCFCFFVF